VSRSLSIAGVAVLLSGSDLARIQNKTANSYVIEVAISLSINDLDVLTDHHHPVAARPSTVAVDPFVLDPRLFQPRLGLMGNRQQMSMSAQDDQSSWQRGGVGAGELLNLGDEAVELGDLEVTVNSAFAQRSSGYYDFARSVSTIPGTRHR
jgi:hypothetical protein